MSRKVGGACKKLEKNYNSNKYLYRRFHRTMPRAEASPTLRTVSVVVQCWDHLRGKWFPCRILSLASCEKILFLTYFLKCYSFSLLRKKTHLFRKRIKIWTKRDSRPRLLEADQALWPLSHTFISLVLFTNYKLEGVVAHEHKRTTVRNGYGFDSYSGEWNI